MTTPIIDFHTHIFPERIAVRALDALSASSHMPYWLDGTADALRKSMVENGITCSVILPVSTSPAQADTINRTAIGINSRFARTGLLSFGGIHPDNDDYRRILSLLAREGVKGIKLHPIFQEAAIDDIRYLRIIDCACSHGLIVLTHAGYDISYPDREYVSPARIQNMLRQLNPPKMVLAHMGGWGCWSQVEELLTGFSVRLDTAFSLTAVRHCTGSAFLPETGEISPDDPDPQARPPKTHRLLRPDDPDYVSPWTPEQETLDSAQFLRLVSTFGEDHILFGSDSPWSSQRQSIQALAESGLKKTALSKIFFENAAKLLNL